jgi:V/A-type H+/Na+-transporting ATPase subunit F
MLGLVIGDSDMVTGFRLVGVEGVEANSADEALDAFEKALARSDLAVVIVSEEFSSLPQLRNAIEKVRQEHVNPLVVEVPGSRGKPSGISMSDLISKTLGVRM